MGGWQELHIQSNIPLIVLALSVICIVVIGFLELKKMTHKINELTVEVQNIKKIKPNEKKELSPKKVSNLTEENIQKQNIIQKQNDENERKIRKELQNHNENNFEKQEGQKNELQQPKLSESQLPPSSEELIMGTIGGQLGFPPMMPGGIASMIIGGGPMMHMEEIHVQNVYDEEMETQELYDDRENQFEEIEDENEINKEESSYEQESSDEKEPMKNIEDTIIINQQPPSPVKPASPVPVVIKEEEHSDDESTIDGSESDDYSESESGSESESEDEKVKLIPGKGKVEEIKEVDRSLSIKELKEICQKMGLSASGNKETLIKRINGKK